MTFRRPEDIDPDFKIGDIVEFTFNFEVRVGVVVEVLRTAAGQQRLRVDSDGTHSVVPWSRTKLNGRATYNLSGDGCCAIWRPS